MAGKVRIITSLGQVGDERTLPLVPSHQMDKVEVEAVPENRDTNGDREPAYGVSGATGGDENTHRRAARHYHRSPEREIEDGDARVRPVKREKHKA